jgi:hypothetical protein
MRKFYLIVALFLLMILTACASVSGTAPTGKGDYFISGAVPNGKDIYFISGKNLSGVPDPQMQTEFFKKASEFCISQGKNFELVQELIVVKKAFHGPVNAGMTFRCGEIK